MTTPSPPASYLDAPTLVGTGIDAAAQNSERLGITWGINLATVLVGNTDASSSNVTVLVDGDAASRQLTIPLIKRRPVYGQIEAPRALQPGDRVCVLNTPTGVLAMPVSPDQEVFTVAPNLFLFDDFSRDQESGWGNPNYGPAWEATSGPSGVNAGAAFLGDEGVVTLSANPSADFSIQLINVRPSGLPPPSSTAIGELEIGMRGEEGGTFNLILSLQYIRTRVGLSNTDAALHSLPRTTLTTLGFPGDFQNGSFVIGTTDCLTPIDIYMTAVGSRINIWSALNSNGINVDAPFNFPTISQSSTNAGSVSLFWNGNVSILIGAIVIRNLS